MTPPPLQPSLFDDHQTPTRAVLAQDERSTADLTPSPPAPSVVPVAPTLSETLAYYFGGRL